MRFRNRIQCRRQLAPCRLLAVLLACGSIAGDVASGNAAEDSEWPGHSAEANRDSSSIWSRVVAVGASATSGVYGPDSTDGTNIAVYRFTRYLDAALLGPHEAVRNFGSTFFFLSPARSAAGQIEKALKAKPSLVVSLDFLFWFCYGHASSEDDRMRQFENGLKLLEDLTCPLIVGDIPDASAATNTMLRPAQVPSLKTIAAANERLRQWAANRPAVKVVGLAKFMEAASRNEPVRVGDLHVRETKLLLQKDKLHPTARGAAVLALAIADAFSGLERDSGRQHVRWDLEAVYEKGLREN